jgi:MFS family permease
VRTLPDVEKVQRRTVRTLLAVQVVGGLGVTTGVAVGVLLASHVLGQPDLAGLVQSGQVLGSALLAIPAAALSVRLGRRVGRLLNGLRSSLGLLDRGLDLLNRRLGCLLRWRGPSLGCCGGG